LEFELELESTNGSDVGDWIAPPRDAIGTLVPLIAVSPNGDFDFFVEVGATRAVDPCVLYRLPLGVFAFLVADAFVDVDLAMLLLRFSFS
jgi:hypothetical protein